MSDSIANKSNLTIEDKRKRVNLILEEAFLQSSHKDYVAAEKSFLKACRIAENIYSLTFSNKDKSLLVDVYENISDFYSSYEDKKYVVQRWYQKLLGVLQDSCKSYSPLDDYHLLMDWYIKTLYLMEENEDYKRMLSTAFKMLSKSKVLYRKTKTIEDMKFIIIAKLYVARGYKNIRKNFKAYIYYRMVNRIMEKVYVKIKDDGLRHDLMEIYENLCALTNKKIFKFIHKKWKYRLLDLKENGR